MNVLANFKKIKTFVFDIDGVLTDGSLLILNDGQMARQMNIKDGYALQLAIKKGYQILIISGSESLAVKIRLQKLGIENVHMNIPNKEEVLKQFALTQHITKEEILYMGDDIPDLAVMQMAGIACCPADAVSEIKSISNYISPFSGGKGCVREVIEKVLKLNMHWEA